MYFLGLELDCDCDFDLFRSGLPVWNAAGAGAEVDVGAETVIGILALDNCGAEGRGRDDDTFPGPIPISAVADFDVFGLLV